MSISSFTLENPKQHLPKGRRKKQLIKTKNTKIIIKKASKTYGK